MADGYDKCWRERYLLMLKRTVTGACITVIMGLVLYYSYIPTVMAGTCVVLAVFSVYEICRASGWLDNEILSLTSLLLAAAVSWCAMPNYLKILRFVFVFAVAGFILMMVRQKRCSLADPVKVFFLALTVILLYKAIPVLRGSDNGIYYLGGAMILCAVTDVAAYLTGRAFGKHKLIPSVSPNKTVEGAVGGVVFAVLTMLMLGLGMEHWQPIRIDYPRLAAYSVMASVVGQFGDLCMSSVKRVCGVKDLGSIFPGHGGMLDRFDSQLMAVPFTLLYCSLTGGFIL